LLATLCLAVTAPALAATPTPSPSPHASGSAAPKVVAIPKVHPPAVPLHTEFVVEVNKKGQVVKAKSGKASKSPLFNAQTYGNVLQMWIRHPDGSADVGLFRVTYDYNPKDHSVTRNIELISLGGNWGDQEGAAAQMIDTARKEAAEAQTSAQKQAQKQSGKLPPLNIITGHPTPVPSPTPTPAGGLFPPR
jgi:hypothetical protein